MLPLPIYAQRYFSKIHTCFLYSTPVKRGQSPFYGKHAKTIRPAKYNTAVFLHLLPYATGCKVCLRRYPKDTHLHQIHRGYRKSSFSLQFFRNAFGQGEIWQHLFTPIQRKSGYGKHTTKNAVRQDTEPRLELLGGLEPPTC